MMKKILYFNLFLLLLILTLTQISYGTENADIKLPSAVVKSDRFEFETVVEGVKVTHTFIISNKGTAPLIIEKVKSG